MARWALGLLVLASGLLALMGPAVAQENADIYVDRAPKDGLPDAGAGTATVGVPVLFDIWVHSQGFSFTGFNIFVQWGTVSPELCYFDRTPANISMTVDPGFGGSADPVDNFTDPIGVGRACFTAPATSNLKKLLIVSLLPTFAGQVTNACITPVIDPSAASGCYLVGPGPSSATFNAGVMTPSCFNFNGAGNPTELTSWGKVKGLYQN